MMAAGILWSHAFAGLLFGLLAVMQARHPAGTWPRAAFVAALELVDVLRDLRHDLLGHGEYYPTSS